MDTMEISALMCIATEIRLMIYDVLLDEGTVRFGSADAYKARGQHKRTAYKVLLDVCYDEVMKRRIILSATQICTQIFLL